MTIEELCLWASTHRFPQLVLAEKEVIYAGDADWARFLHHLTEKRLALVLARIERWQERERGK